MRVTHITSGLSTILGGTAVAVAEIAKAQRRAGLGVAIVSSYCGETDGTGAALREQGVEVNEVGPCKQPLQRHPSMGHILEKWISQSDVVHVHALWEEIQHRGAVISRKLRKPYVFTPHGMLDPWSLSQSRWKKRLYRALRLTRDLNGAAAIHYTSTIERDGAVPLKLSPPPIVEPNGVDLREFDQLPARGSFRSRHPEIGDRPIVLFLSRVHPKKGLDLLIPAFAAAQIPRAVLVIAGPDNDDYAEQVRAEGVRAGIGDRLIFTGMLRGRERIEPMVDAEIFVLPSYQENFGIVVTEALAAGCPVVISDQVNIYSEISAAGVGAVVPTQVKPLTDAMKLWMSNPAQRAAAAAKAPGFVREHYDWDRIAERWAGHYARLIKGVN